MIMSQNMAKSEEADNYSDTASKAALLEKAKNEFNREKRLIIKNLPSNTTEKDIRAFMGFNGEFPVELVDMVKNCNQAIVTLKDPSLVDDAISKLDCTKLDTLTVSVSVYRSEKVLCIAQIPQSMTEYRFRELVLEHGNIDMCFLMRSEITGESKGYGFVEYNEPIEKVGQIKCALDWSSVDDQTVHCDAIVESSQLGITFEELHSKCLIIDNLPKDYSDSIALREVFSVLVKPVYCQIVTKESESLGFGIVEFDEAEDAETAFTEFKQHKINDVPMNIAYCIPGKSAVHMFNRIMFKYGDSVHVNRSSLLPDPIYPNPAFLKHMFFKMHVAKHPKLLVQFTDNLLHLQDGYVKRLEDKTNAKPGILGPAPTIPMSPLMDINLQLGLLSLVVLDMREKGTYNGEVPEPLGKVKIPTDEEFQEIAQPVSLLGDPMTAQANVILRNLLMPNDKPQFQKLPSTDQCNPQLLSKSVHELNMVYLCSLGRLMAMLSEKTQSMGILGNAPNITVSKPSSRPPKPLMEGVSPKPLMEGLMQAGKVAQTLLNSMGISQQNQLSQLNRNQQKGLLGNPPMMNMNTTRAASNFMNTMQQCNGGKQDFNSLFGSNNGSSGNMNKSGILGNYQGHGRMNIQSQNKHQSKKQLSGRYESEKAPQSLLALNFNNQGDGLIPTPLMDDDSSHGMQVSGYDDSGYQGGFEDGDCNEGYADAQSNFVDRGNNTANQMGTKQAARSLLDPELDVTGSSNRFDGVYFSGINGRQKTGTGMNMMSEKRDGVYYNDIAQQAALYAAGAAAAYKHQYDEWVQSGYNQSQEYDGNIDSGYPTNYSSDQSNYGQDGMSNRNQQWGSYMGSYSGNGGPPSLLGSFDGSGGQPSSMGSYSGNGGPPSLLGSFDGSGGQQPSSKCSYSGNGGPPSLLDSFDGSGGQSSSKGSYSGNAGPPSLLGSFDGSGGQPSSKGSYSGNAGPPSLLGSFDGSGGQPSSMGSYSGNGGQSSSMGSYSGNGGPPSLLGSFDGSGGQSSSMGSYSGNEGLPSLLGSYTKDGNMKSGSSSLNVRERNSRSESSGYAGSYGRDGPRSLMGPPSIRPLQGTATLGSGVSQSSLANTPLCPKRSFSHVLPSPEPSPEGEYIGQHSQGLGGHYADTYTKRQKLSGRF